MVMWSAVFGVFLALVGGWANWRDRQRRKRAIEKEEARLAALPPLFPEGSGSDRADPSI